MSRLFSASVINEVSEKNQPHAVAYFFFDRRDSQSERQLHSKLIRSLISQFAHQRGGIPGELVDLYRRCGDNQQPTVNQLQKTLHDILDGFLHAYIIIDALDECSDRERTLTWVDKLVSDTHWTAVNLHIMVTSRPERDIEQVCRTFDPYSIDISEATANEDIFKYLDRQMEFKFKKYDEITRKKIESGLRERADGS
ncbi:hypothetical protein GALMADRAFT_74301 [Galerina marginata CBS 339.88]|uniref:Nephrocystin 3-like N-terminal domain-containing protein n=1 Tax=Galerina marginata (strain CBS 339.88) TaxID=685588 RepID=A0A067SPU7_GALM3|nr:hypothetical protein GALMADRAFT_74301 [Galerina marginata CBS 339.88]